MRNKSGAGREEEDMVMWTRAGLKEQANANLKMYYWNGVLVIFLAGLIGGVLSLLGSMAGMLIPAVGSLLVTIFGGVFSRNIAKLLKATELLIDDSSMYIFVISFFAPVISNMYLMGFTDRVIGKPNQYLYGAIASLAANVISDYLLIAVCGLGVKGGALATGLSYFIALAICSIPLFKRKNVLNYFKGKLNFKLMLPVVANGSSEAVVCGSAAIAVFLFNSALIKIAGESGVAAFTIINYISTFGTLAMFGISDGINAIISYN